MIALATPSPVALEELARRPGSFLWWYVDLTTEAGDALVLIWSLGLPFLPARADRPREMPTGALSLALYRKGRPDFFLLQDYAVSEQPVELGRSVLGQGRLGATTIQARTSGGTVELDVHLDEPIPASRQRLTGTLRLSGPEYVTREDLEVAPHLWAPRVVHARAHAALMLGREPLELHGAGYFDSNVGRVPLQSQPIARWLWGRIAFEDRTFAYYVTEGSDRLVESRVVSQGPHDVGVAHPADVGLAQVRRGMFGLEAPRQVAFRADEGEVRLELGALVDDGPFYQRFLVTGTDHAGRAGRGIAEVVVPGRLDVSWQRPFVRMRTHLVGGRNSLWLPLFSGARRGRVGRLLGLEAK